MIASPYSYESSSLSAIEVLERGALAIIVSFRNGHLSSRWSSNESSFLSLSSQFSTSSLSSLADAAGGFVGDVAATCDRGLKRGGSWIDDASATSESSTAGGHVVSDEESASRLTPKRSRGRPVDDETLPSDVVVIAAEGTTVPTSLYADDDEEHINPIHNIIRRDILEVFVEAPPPHVPVVGAQDAPGSEGGKAVRARQSRFAGRIGLRCMYCKHLPVGTNANLATIYPETLEGIYRACSVRFQKRHIGSCKYIPESIRSQLAAHAKEKSCRGSKDYWVESALRKGFRTSETGKGIVFCPEIEH